MFFLAMQNMKKGYFYLVHKGLILLTSRSYHFDCAAKKNKNKKLLMKRVRSYW